ncbi:MAG: ATP-dependent DNA helicase RecG [Patescibacteria group bacterium]|jgi:ATP-dependent DNA helicase RecG
MNLSLDSKISQVSPYAKRLANKLRKLNIETVRDLIFYYPFRYEDYSKLAKIADLKEGMEAAVIGRLELVASRRSHRQRKVVTEAVLTDDTGSIKLVWFNQPWIGKTLAGGELIRVYGKIGGDMYSLHFNSPNYERTGIGAPGLVPIYPLTSGLTNKQLRFLLSGLKPLITKVNDYLPEEITGRQNLISLSSALLNVHWPENASALAAARHRLAFDELFLLQTWSQILRRNLKELAAPPIEFKESKVKEFIARLPFELTLDQKRAAWEIIKDLAKTEPMNRLLEGDVGSGKTVVALIAMYDAVLNGQQAVLMVPTEILASQHYQSISKLLDGCGVNSGLLTRTQKVFNGKEISKKEFLNKAALGEIDLIIGTHSLIQKEASFKRLGLVIVDEQHRFGVKQRQELKQKGVDNKIPHFLSLTATPIPRSLALIVYGDLDLSLIKELPKGRKAIITKVVPPDKRWLAYEFIDKQIAAGRQVFVICPLIDPSDKLGVRSVTEEFHKLDKEVFPQLPVGLLHGKLKAEEKEGVMAEFKNNKIKILVSTSVVEVGVDIPNATVMMIEGAERFGLSQLHQFRGRVGRGDHQSYCFLFSEDPSDRALARLNYLSQTTDGFALAEYDMKQRGGGNVFGQEQSGFIDNLKIADPGDLVLAKKARDAAKDFVTEFRMEDFPQLAEAVSQFGLTAHLE